MKAIIVDDEPRSQKKLRNLLAGNHPEVELPAIGKNVAEGVQLIRQHRPDVVFLDIEMPDGLGFDLLQQLEDQPFQVIFTTAYNQYAINAIRAGALDYLLKPVAPDELAAAIRRVSKKLKEKISEEQIQILIEGLSNGVNKPPTPTRIAIPTSKGIYYQKVADITRLEAQKNYTDFHIKDLPRPIVASQNLGEYLEQFKGYQDFMRVHRSHMVNLMHVQQYLRTDGGYLVMQDGAKVSVSHAYRDELFKRLESI